MILLRLFAGLRDLQNNYHVKLNNGQDENKKILSDCCGCLFYRCMFDQPDRCEENANG